MDLPKIVERKIVVLRKPDGSKQYLITLPKEYGEGLEREGIGTLLIAYDSALGGFPRIHGFTEEALLSFLKSHRELRRLFARAGVKGDG